MYEHWTQEQWEQATGRWVSTEHEGAPPDTSRLLVHIGEFNDPYAVYTVGYYHHGKDMWFVKGWVGVETFGGYKGIPYWRLLPGREG